MIEHAPTSLPRRVLLELTPSEAEFQRRVLTLADRFGWLGYHTHWSKHSAKGFPDLVLARPPRLIFAELKVWPRLAPRPEQADWLDQLRGVPCIEAYLWVWVFGNDIEREIAEVLAR